MLNDPISSELLPRGHSEPQGVSLAPVSASGPAFVNFALWSSHSTRVWLQLYRADELHTPIHEFELDPSVHRKGCTWACQVPLDIVRSVAYYAYRCDGPRASGAEASGRLAFDPDKVLLDPYATSIEFPPAFDRAAAANPGSNAGKAPLGVLPTLSGPEVSIAPRSSSRAIARDDIAAGGVYELHVRGFTRHASSDVERSHQGTFMGAIDKIPYLKSLGVSAVELMPVFQYCPQEGNYWGYMPISFFGVHQQYASEAKRAAKEFRKMVDAFHAEGIAVLIDTVHNHTGEGPPDARVPAGQPQFPTYSWRGVDAEDYYMHGHRGQPYSDFTGCGNTFNICSRAGRRLVVDSLRYWRNELGVDGFRHDLAAVCARREDGAIDPDPRILAAIEACGELRDAVHIVEPWDFEGAYLPGSAFPAPGARQWNGKFRDDIRRFVRGDREMTVGTLMQRLYGSDDLFPDRSASGSYTYSPRQSVNYIASHDGFSLYDLTAYTRRRNEANGHRNTDGPSDEISFNCGYEGDEGASSGLVERRIRSAAALLALLFLSAGTPMIRMGDEFLQTQLGNSNPYNQDNATTWLDWSRLERFGSFQKFVRGMIAFRRAHPILWSRSFWRERISWFGAIGAVDFDARSRELAYLLRGEARPTGTPALDLYVMINMGQSDRPYAIQRAGRWHMHINSASLLASTDAQEPRIDQSVLVSAGSIVVLSGQANE